MNKNYALQRASENGHLEVVKYLLQNGAKNPFTEVEMSRLNQEIQTELYSFNNRIIKIKKSTKK